MEEGKSGFGNLRLYFLTTSPLQLFDEMATGMDSVLDQLAWIDGTSSESTKLQLTLLSSTLSLLQQQAQDIDSGKQPCEASRFSYSHRGFVAN